MPLPRIGVLSLSDLEESQLFPFGQKRVLPATVPFGSSRRALQVHSTHSVGLELDRVLRIMIALSPGWRLGGTVAYDRQKCAPKTPQIVLLCLSPHIPGIPMRI